MTNAVTGMQLDGENPWPGLESFKESASAFFFGRVREAESLLSRVRDAPVTVLYGQSGLGKTSLLQAGLFPLLRGSHFLPVYVRLEVKPDAPLSRELYQSVRESIQAEVPDAKLPSDDESLWEWLHRTDFELWSAQNYPLTPVIVVDQFEEVFTLGERVPDLVKAFRDDFGDLVENRIPADLAARIEVDEAVARQYSLRSHNYKLLISLREDFLPDLEEWCQLIPALGRSRVRLLPLNTDAALKAVHEPAKDLMTASLAKRVVDIVAGEDLRRGRGTPSTDAEHPGHGLGAADVEPALLSLFCRELNEERKRLGRKRFDEQLVEGAKRGVLSNYYTSWVGTVPPHVARFIESELITQKGFRNSAFREDAVPSRLTEEELARLVDSRLLRLEERRGGQWIELTHDVLTPVVREHRDRRSVDEEREQEKEELAAKLRLDRQAERERFLESEARSARRLRRLMAALALVCVVASGLAMTALYFWRKADANAKEATANFREATAESLDGQSALLQADLPDKGSNDTTIMQNALIANHLTRMPDNSDQLLSVLNYERDLLKIIDIPSQVYSASFSADGTRIASGGADKSVRLWDAATGQPVGPPLLGHEDVVLSVAFSADGTRIVSGGADKSVRLWDAATGQPVGPPLLGHEDVVSSVAFNADGTRIVSGGADKSVRLWDAATGQPVGPPLLGHDAWVRSVVFSADGTRIASGGADKSVRLWDAATGQPVGSPLSHENVVTSVAFSPDGTQIASGSVDKSIRLWDAATGQPIGPPLLGHQDVVLSVAFSPDGTRVASGGADKTVRLWDAATVGAVGVLRGHEDMVQALAFSKDSSRLVSGSLDRTVRVWDTRSWQPLLGHNRDMYAKFSNDGHRIVSASADKEVRWWDAATGSPIGPPRSIPDDKLRALYPVDEDRLLSIGRVDGVDAVRLWDAHTLDPVGEPLLVPPDSLMLTQDSLIWTKKVDRIAGQTGSGAVQVLATDTMLPIGRPIKPATEVGKFEFSTDGRVLATGGQDGTVQLWDAGTGDSISDPMKGRSRVTTIAFSPDGHLLAVGYEDSTLRLWDTGSFQSIGDLTSPASSPANIAAFSPDGGTLASGSLDGTIRLWGTSEKTQLGAALTGHESAVTDLEFSPDGTKLLSASFDRTIRFWPMPPPTDVARDQLCAKLTNNMNREQWNEFVSPKIPYIEVCDGLPEAS